MTGQPGGLGASTSRLTRALWTAVRFRYAAVTAVFLLSALVGSQDNGDLEYFTQAWQLLVHGGAGGNVHLYAARPDIQIGPLAVVGTGLVDLAFGGKIVLAVVAIALAALLVTVRGVERLARAEGLDDGRTGIAVLVGGMALAAGFAVVVPGWGHVDDLAALAAMVAALAATRSGRAIPAGLLLAMAVDCKPWGAFAAGLLLFLPAGVRLRGLGTFGLGALACWLPFLIGDLHTLPALAHFSLHAVYGSLPLQLGYATAPSWVRPAQLLTSLVAVACCVRWRRPDLALLCVAVCRLVLDAGDFPYYDVELLLGCLVADTYAAGHARRLVAAATPLTLGAWFVITVVHDADLSSAQTLAARCALYALLLSVALVRGRVGAASALNSAVAGADTTASGQHGPPEGGPVGRPRALVARGEHAA